MIGALLGLAKQNPQVMEALQRSNPGMARMAQVMGGQAAQPQTPPATAEDIQRLYRDTLGREASPEEIQSHIGNPGGYAGVMNTIKTSPEYQQLMANPIGIQGDGRGWGNYSPGQDGTFPGYTPGQEPPVSSGPIRKTGGEISDSTKKIVELSMEYQKMFPGPVNQDHQSRWFADRSAPIGHLVGGMPGGEWPTLQPGYTPPREGGFTGTTGSSWANIDPRESIGFRLPSQGLWSKPAQSSGGYLQALNPTGAYGASNSWDAISKGVTNLAGSMNKSANTSGYTKPRSSISLDPQPADPWTRPTRKQW